MFELDRPALKPLPGEPYEYAEWRVWRVGWTTILIRRLVCEELDARITAQTVELFR
jgi:hypothetical protein